MNVALHTRLTRLHKFSLYAVVLVAFGCIAFGGAINPLVGLGFVVAAAVSWFTDEAGLFSPASARWWNVLVLGFIAVSVVQLATTDTAIIDAAIRFVLLLTAVKLFGRFSGRDDLQIYALSFLLFASATGVNEGLTYGLLFGLYVLAGTFSLALFHLTAELDDHRRLAGANRTPFDGQYMAVLAAISAVIFVSSLVIFFTFPRVGLGFFVTKSRQNVSVTGFSESVELGSHGQIRDNPEVVMRVEFPGGRPADYESLHWRTKTFDRYDGTQWSRTLSDTERSLVRRDGQYPFDEYHPEWTAGISKDAKPMVLDVYLEPMNTNVLPRLWPTGSVDLGADEVNIRANPNSGGVTVDAYGDLRHTIESEIGVAYSLTKLGRPRASALGDQHFDSAQHGPNPRYLELPETSRRFTDLADEITDAADGPYDKARAVADYLQANYAYTTDLPEVDSKRPIESFVFDTRRGHCEYFATTAALLLRAADIPTRLVNGFLGGRWNRVGNYLSVREGDAHAWIEVYIPNFGWTPVDPTPAAEVLPVKPTPFVGWYRDVYDTARLHWMQWVIEYDLESQIDLFKNAGKALAPSRKLMNQSTKTTTKDDAFDRVPVGILLGWLGLLAGVAGSCWTTRRSMRADRHIRGVLAGLAWLAGLAGWMMIWREFSFRWAGLGALAGVAGVGLGAVTGYYGRYTSDGRLTGFFAKIERAGAAAGIERASDEGPAAYLNRLASDVPDAKAGLAVFRQRYLAARFGGRQPGAKQMTGLAKLVGRICKKLRSG